MRVHLSGVLALLVATALHGGSSTAERSVMPAPVAHCATKADPATLAAHSKANSFAPHPGGSQSRVYGVPIQPRIFKSRPKKKPQLTSTPLPGS